MHAGRGYTATGARRKNIFTRTTPSSEACLANHRDISLSMKIRRSNAAFEPSRRRRQLPIIRIAVAVIIVAILAFAWQRGGEQAQHPVEKPIAADRLGK